MVTRDVLKVFKNTCTLHTLGVPHYLKNFSVVSKMLACFILSFLFYDRQTKPNIVLKDFVLFITTCIITCYICVKNSFI